MLEPYFEEQEKVAGTIQCPFSSFITGGNNSKIFIRPHWHYYIELLYSLSGNARVILGGQLYDFNPGDMVLINAREVHSIYSDDGKTTRYIVVKFDPEVLYTTPRTVFESKYVLPFTMAKSDHQKMFICQEIENTPLPALMHEIYDEYNCKAYGYELAVRTDICRIFLWVLRNWNEKGLDINLRIALKEININKLQTVFDYLDENFHESISTKKAAQLCNMSASYFCRFFKEVMGKTFTEYLNYIRVTEAEKLLLTTDMNITQIAYNTGFSNSSYFIKQFKHYNDMSPKQYKKRLWYSST